MKVLANLLCCKNTPNLGDKERQIFAVLWMPRRALDKTEQFLADEIIEGLFQTKTVADPQGGRTALLYPCCSKRGSHR